MKLNNTRGCALCNSTWGDFYTTIDDEKLFFCCDICAKAFRKMIERIKSITHWNMIDTITIIGGTRGRCCLASSKNKTLSFNIAFDSTGNISSFSIKQ